MDMQTLIEGFPAQLEEVIVIRTGVDLQGVEPRLL